MVSTLIYLAPTCHHFIMSGLLYYRLMLYLNLISGWSVIVTRKYFLHFSQRCNMETLFLNARVQRKDIAYVSHTMEGYEGMATVTTIDPEKGLIRITVSPSFLKEVKKILAQLQIEVGLELLDEHD